MTRDVAKIGAGLARPGMDPRKFAEMGVVTAVAVSSKGIYADIVTTEGIPETAALAPPYAGPGYGFYFPVDVDETVVLAVPDGKFNAGARIVGRVWDPGDPPPPEVPDHPEDVILVVKKGESLRLIVSGGGNVEIEARDGASIRLGGESATAPVQTTDDGATFMLALDAAITANTISNPQGAAFGTSLKSALQAAGWPRGSSVAKATP